MFSESISSINNKNKFVEKEHATEINAKIQELENEINRIKVIFNKFVWVQPVALSEERKIYKSSQMLWI